MGVLALFAFYLANIISWPFIGAAVPASRMLFDPGTLLHLAGSLWFAGVWLFAKRADASLTTLRVLDAVALIGGCGLYAAMGRHLTFLQSVTGHDTWIGLYAGVLACVNTIMARAIMVPSRATRTCWLSFIAALPLIPAAAATTGVAAAVVNVACWAAVAVAIATLGSRVIFGLRSEAARVKRLGQYTLEEKIGAGGMGIVYRASHAMLRRPTAIKLLPPDRAGEANLQRFEREVQMTAKLSHPNTITIYDYGRTPDGVFYYAMEYLDGITLEELVRRGGPLPPGRVIHVLRQVCRALAEAHDRALLHRDIKPANIFLTERGGEPDVVKVLDFGLVKTMSSDSPEATMSAAIVLAGTPLYMPPESMLSPHTADARSDLYAVGAVGYYLLTARTVFEGATVAEVFAQHLQAAPVPPSQRTATFVPPDLDAVILRCLSKQLAERPPDARSLERELKRCAAEGTWTTEDAGAWWQRFRAVSPPAMTETRRADEGVTVLVDIDERLATR